MQLLRRLPTPVKQFLIRTRDLAVELTALVLAPVLAPIISYMARTGAGTDACLRRASLPMPVHYYSPVPDLADLEQRDVWNRRSPLWGIDFRADAQVALLKQMGDQFGRECDWPATPTDDPGQFYTENSSFSYGCAASTYSLLRAFRPSRVIEIGSGHSSLVISQALQANARQSEYHAADYTIIDPNPRPVLGSGLPGLTRLLKQRVETLDASYFDLLKQNDVLFIDSGHAVRIGGDVNYLILDVLPRLADGVLVHFHDISLPYEYPKTYAVNPRFRMFWTEAYMLQAFLCLNSQFEVLLAMHYLMIHEMPTFRASFPLHKPAEHVSGSGSFWIRRTIAEEALPA